MGSQTFSVSGRTNYKGGSKNTGGSHLVGWDSGKVRAEQWKFTTGQWPVTQISFTYNTSVYSGKDIKIRCGISTSKSSYTNSSGSSSGYAVSKNKKTTITKSLNPRTTYYITFFPGVGKSTYGLLNGDGSWSIAATVTDRTACGAPTEITIEPVIQTIEQPATLSWSGAVDGTNVPIASYDVYRSTTLDGEYEKINGEEVITGTSYTVTAPDTAEASYFYKVKTIASIAGYDSVLSTAYAQLTANQPPEVPTITRVSRTTVPSTGENVEFDVSPGTIYKSDASPTLWYSTSPSGDKTQFISPLTVSVTVATTFYFYTYDGTDYSQAVSQAIAVNTKPAITNITSVLTTYQALGGDGAVNNQLGYASAITPTITTNKEANVKIFLEYYAIPAQATEGDAWDSYGVQTQSEVLLETRTTETLSNCKIHSKINNWRGETTIHWRLRFILNDGIEDSDPAYFPHDDGVVTENDKYYALAHAPAVTTIYNRFNTSDITGTIHGQVWNQARLVIPYDGSITKASVSAITSTGATPLDTSCVFDDDHASPNVYQYIDVTLPNDISGEAIIIITATLTDNDNAITKITSAQVTETKTPSLSNLVYGANNIKPFTQTGTFEVVAGWPFGNSSTLPDGYAAYNCAVNSLKLVYSSSNNGDGANKVEKSPSWTGSMAESKVSATMVTENEYGWYHSLGYMTYAGKLSYYCRLEITNLFGRKYISEWSEEKKFNFDEKAENTLKISGIEYSTDYDPADPSSATWADLENNAIQKGLYLRVSCDFNLYTSDKITVELLVSSTTLAERSAFAIGYEANNLNRAESNTEIGENHEKYIFQVGDISDTTDRTWKLKITGNDGSITSIINNPVTKIIRQCAPTIDFTQCLVSKTYGIHYEFTISDTGIGTIGSLQYCLCDEENSKTPLNSLANVGAGTTTGDFNITPTPSPAWNSRKISVKIVSTVTGLITNVEEYYSNIIIAYQVTPTIAYRLNAIGINANDPESGAAVDIHQAGLNSKVFIQGQDSNNTATRFEIDVTTGVIKFYKGNSTTPISTLDFINKIWT